MLSSENLADIVCPVGRKELIQKDNFLVCSYCGVKYPVVEGIPVLLIDDAILPEGVNSLDELKCMVK